MTIPSPSTLVLDDLVSASRGLEKHVPAARLTRPCDQRTERFEMLRTCLKSSGL